MEAGGDCPPLALYWRLLAPRTDPERLNLCIGEVRHLDDGNRLQTQIDGSRQPSMSGDDRPAQVDE